MSLARISCVAVLALTTACAGTLKNGIYREGDVRYRVGSIPAGWKAVGLSGNDLAYQSLDSPHSVAINATCVDHDDPPLDVLTRHLLMGFTERETLSQEVEALDGRDALRTRVTAKLGGLRSCGTAGITSRAPAPAAWRGSRSRRSCSSTRRKSWRTPTGWRCPGAPRHRRCAAC